MELTISSVLVKQITDHVATSADEVCGLLFGNDGTVSSALACANVAANPAQRFEIDPAALIAAHRRARGGGQQVIGHYHSHPGGSPIPSPRDAADAPPDGSIWLIVGRDEMRGWRAVDHGTVERRFDPVRLVVACAGESGRSEALD